MTAADESDESLIAQYARGDTAAFDLLYRRHEMRTWRYLHRAIRDKAIAEELLQEVWFAVARDALRYVPTARFTTWLFTIAHNRLIDLIRARRQHVSLDSMGYDAEPLLTQLTADPSTGPLAAAIAQDEAALLSQALDRLPAEQREALLLQLEGDLSTEEIAAIMESSFETTKSRLRYARTKLRELLTEHA
jgi:RNA polymerase sigma-70 factor (ECF subfamily)